jgi:hypothetical protein
MKKKLQSVTYLTVSFLILNPDCAVESLARRRKLKRNEQLDRFCDVGIVINMSRSKIGKQALQQEFSSRSKRLLHNLGLALCAWMVLES